MVKMGAMTRKWIKRIFNPLMAFIGIQIAWVLAVIVWLNWFLGSHRKLQALAEKYSPELLVGGPDWLILTEGLLLLVSILVGVYVIFLYWRRQAALYNAQRSFIAQVSHELKSPLASLQLHLETIRRLRPGPEKMETFVDTMLSDTDRLGTLIDNLLSASRFEQRSRSYLERLVHERTRELHTAQDELVHAARMAALGQMSAALAHEINQPLTALRMQLASLRLLLDSGRDGDRDDHDQVEEELEALFTDQ